MIRRRLLQEWSLAAFTVAIQAACGITIAIVIADRTQSAQPRHLGIAVFPIVAAGLLASLFHLGRPRSAWRALSNSLHSRLSREVLATAAFAAASFAYSLSWWLRATWFRLQTGTIASVAGIAAVLACAAVYKVTAKPLWNSACVTISFVASTIVTAGLALEVAGMPSRLGLATLMLGYILLLVSGTWMWLKSSCPPQLSTWLRVWFTAYALLLAMPAYLSLSSSSARSQGAAHMILLCGATVMAVLIGRLLMFALAELEVQF